MIEKNPLREIFQSNTKYFLKYETLLCFDPAYITWRKSSQSQWNAREIISSLILILKFKNSTGASKQLFCHNLSYVKLGWVLKVTVDPSAASLVELTDPVCTAVRPLPRRKLCLLFLLVAYLLGLSSHYQMHHICHNYIECICHEKHDILELYRQAPLSTKSKSFALCPDNRKWKWRQISTKYETVFNRNFQTVFKPCST